MKLSKQGCSQLELSKMKRLGLIGLLLVVLVSWCSAQNVLVNEEDAISRMLDRHIQSNKSNTFVQGWRVQIFSTSDRGKVENAKKDFLQNNPGIPVDWTHSKPYYRLRAGAFSSKLEAMRLLNRLKRDYPSAFPAKDANISLREIVGL